MRQTRSQLSKRRYYKRSSRSRSRERRAEQRRAVSSEKPKKEIRKQFDKLDAEKKDTKNETSKKSLPLISVEDQLKRANQIQEINECEEFESKSFVSSKNDNKSTPFLSTSFSLTDIPLPSNPLNWRENPELALHPRFLNTNDANERWLKKLAKMRRKRRA